MKKLFAFIILMVAANVSISMQARVIEPKTMQEFNSQLSNGTVAVFFGTMSCPHCRKFLPIFGEVAMSNNNAKFIFAEIGQPPLDDLMHRYHVQGPTLKVFKNGTEVATIPSERLNKQTLINAVQ